ncbi:MAG: hypothetical protein K1X72_23960 [Pyrinomonadaceae bacterium]|nr:hypothetical protein [Pyrinomonadaceae bacterium]
MKYFSKKACYAVIILFVSLIQTYSQNQNSGLGQPAITPTRSTELRIFDTPFVVNTYEQQNGAKKSPITFIVLHHFEQTGLNLVKDIIKQRRSGRLVELVSKMEDKPQRYLFFKFNEKTICVDPNRIFSEVGDWETLKKDHQTDTENGSRLSDGSFSTSKCENKTISEFRDQNNPITKQVLTEIKNFSENLKAVFLPRRNDEIVVAVHNNTNTAALWSDTSISIKEFVQGRGGDAKQTEAVYIFNEQDLDNFFIVSKRRLFDKLFQRDRTFNIAIQKQDPKPDDGALSIFCGLKKINYINIEAQHDVGKDRQREMINTVFDLFPPR